MKYNLKENSDGTVNFAMEAGKDFVIGNMLLSDIKELERNCEAKKSSLKHYPIQLGLYHFEGSVKK